LRHRWWTDRRAPQGIALQRLARIVLHVGRSNFWSGTGAPRRSRRKARPFFVSGLVKVHATTTPKLTTSPFTEWLACNVL